MVEIRGQKSFSLPRMVRYFPSQGLKHSVVYGSLKFSPHAELITSLFHHLFPTGHEQENVGHGNIAQFNSNTFLGIFFKVKCIKPRRSLMVVVATTEDIFLLITSKTSFHLFPFLLILTLS